VRDWYINDTIGNRRVVSAALSRVIGSILLHLFQFIGRLIFLASNLTIHFVNNFY
jgi:hypothetical protein